MSTAAAIMMAVAWGYILAMVLYFFTKLLRKEREAKRGAGRAGQAPPPAQPEA